MTPEQYCQQKAAPRRMLSDAVDTVRNRGRDAGRQVLTGLDVGGAELDQGAAQVLDPGQIQLIAQAGSNDTEPVSAHVNVIENVLQQGRVAVIPGFTALFAASAARASRVSDCSINGQTT